jgi:hypothetical protein
VPSSARNVAPLARLRYFLSMALRWRRAATTFALLAIAACSRSRGAEVSPSSASATPDAAPAEAAAAAPNAPTEARAAAAEPEPEPRCEDAREVRLFAMPETPSKGSPLRVVAVSNKPLTGVLRIAGESGNRAEAADRRGGPPYFWVAEIAAPAPGAVAATLTQSACAEGENVATRKIAVSSRPAKPPASPAEGIWPARASWSRSYENLYSAWIEVLFDAPDAEMPSWPALHEVLRDPKRNLLFDHLGNEDSSRSMVVRPDCADLPYFLRAYFAWKMHLPFGLAECNRGGGGAPPTCKNLITNEDPPVRPRDTEIAGFTAFLRGTLADKAHSGSARARMDDPASDYYGVPLTWESLRPGTVFADPYGHILMVSKKLPQTAERGGVLLAVDGQPDGTVARKRFWRGNFLYANDRALGGPGWKRFRPVVRRGGKLVRLDDDAIRKHPGYGDATAEPSKLDTEGFYDAMDDVLSPRPLDPERAMMETIDALEEQVRTRVVSIENGRKWLASGKGPAAMPDGPEIFETMGPWEDFSTPSRDLRLLIAIDVARGFPARVARRADRYAGTSGRDPGEVQAQLDGVLQRELRARSIAYTRTDGSSFTLTLAEVLARSAALEMAYNPNECVENRWGAPAGSPEAATCRSRAPAEQRAKMNDYRRWFSERRRPARK